MQFGTPDLIILGIIGLSVVIGIFRGFTRELLSLITWVVAITLSIMFTNQLAPLMTFTKTGTLQQIFAFLILFVGTIFVGAIVNFFIGSLISKTPFYLPDRILGSLFGFLRGIVFVSILLLLARLTPLPEADWWKHSFTVQKFQPLVLWMKERLPDEQAKAFESDSPIHAKEANQRTQHG